MIPFLIAIPLIAHGLANIIGFIEAMGKAPRNFYDKPWLFSSGITMQSPIGKIFGLLWLASTILLVAAGVGLLLHSSWWSALAIAGSLCSLLAIVPWWNTVVPGAKAGAAFDLIILVVLLTPLRDWLHRAIGS